MDYTNLNNLLDIDLGVLVQVARDQPKLLQRGLQIVHDLLRDHVDD